MSNKEPDPLRRKVTKRDVIGAVIMFFLVLVPPLLRNLYPNHSIIQGLFGGFKLSLYLVLIFIGAWKIENWLKKKERGKRGESQIDNRT